MSCELQSPSALLESLMEADDRISSADLSDPHAFYTLLHELTARIAPADAFYVAQYLADAQSLNFSFNVDCGVYDRPCTLPLGNGPTSWVVRNNDALWWNSLEEAMPLRRVTFGNHSRASHSAVHLPIRDFEGDVIGVLSAQSYASGAYPAEIVRVLQWLADNVGRAISRHRTEAATRSTLNSYATARLQTVAQFTKALADLETEAQRLRDIVLPENTTLRAEMTHFLRRCHALQTHVSEQNLEPLEQVHASTKTRGPEGTQLTDREQEILRFVASGHSNAQIADQLFVSVNTVKFHCKSIMTKLGARNRTEAAHFYFTQPVAYTLD